MAELSACRIGALIGGAGGEGLIHLGAQLAVVRVHHHRQVGRDIQSEQPPLFAFKFSHLTGSGTHAVGQTGQLGFIVHQLVPTLGCVQHVVAETGGQLGEAGLNFTVALLRLGRQTDTGEAEVTQGILDLLALGAAQQREIIALGEGQIGLIEPFMLTNIGLEFGEQRQASIMGLAQRFAVEYGVEVADR